MKFRYRTLVCLVAISVFILSWPLLAGVCRVQRIVSPVYSHSYAQPVYLKQVYPASYYAVGTDLQLEAIAEKLALRIEQRLIEKQKAAQPQSTVADNCARCHSPKSKAVVEGAPAFFDDLGNLTATPEQRASMKTAAHLGAMPPPPAKQLDDDTYLRLVQELKQGGARRTAPPPPPVEELPKP